MKVTSEEEKDHIDDDAKQMEELMYLEAAEVIERFPEKSPIFMLSMKRRVYWTAQIVFTAFLGMFLYMGYNQIFQNNYLFMVPLFLLLGILLLTRISDHSSSQVFLDEGNLAVVSAAHNV